MNLKSHDQFSASVILSVILSVVAGCGKDVQPVDSESSHTSNDATRNSAAQADIKSAESALIDEEHPHKPGTHGGIIIPIGSDSYHAEAVIEAGGDFRLLMLQKDETRILEVERQSPKAYVKAVGDPSAIPVELSADPQEGDAEDKTSQFVGKLPASLQGKQLDVTIPSLRIGGERFRIGFTTVTESHVRGMPASLPADEERQLYLTPGGKYTEADIKANGSVTASEKFKGIISKHDAKPKPGDRLCPISMTKANPEFTWVIDGQPYQFCCPPCVDEFVKSAKEQPESLMPPDTYIKSAN